jgi:hypothetical protein
VLEYQSFVGLKAGAVVASSKGEQYKLKLLGWSRIEPYIYLYRTPGPPISLQERPKKPGTIVVREPPYSSLFL